MAYSAKVGSFNIDTTKTVGQTQAISGVGFLPKIVLFWWGGSTGTGDTVAGGTINVGFGAAIDSTHRFAVVGISEDAQAASDTGRSQNTSECIRCYTDTDTLDGIMDFSSMDADGFTLVVDDQFTQAYRISYLALGGTDLTNVFIGSKAMPTVVGNYNVAGVGFQPDALITCGSSGTNADYAYNTLYFGLGMATSADNQGAVLGTSDDNAATTNTLGYGYNGETYAMVSPSYREAFVSFGADGFTMNHLEGGSVRYYYYICLKGGQYTVGDLTTRTDGNDISETVGFQPAAILFASANRALSTQDTSTPHNRLSIGAATSASNRACAAISDEDALADSETAYANYDSAVYAHVADDAIVALMDLKSIDADGFTCVMDDTETAGCWVTYLAIGESEASPSASPSGSPSHSPSASPSEGTPSGSPSHSPSASPSASPSEGTPSGSPSASPSEGTPSGSPSHSPSASPSEGTPSGSPSATPSASPSEGTPSASPSGSPSASPSEGTPSASPSHSPSASPSEGTPSGSPSGSPSASPSEGTPSGSPSGSPSATPSHSPSASPSEGTPSASPSHSPSASPSEGTPSGSPSKSPSASPSEGTPSGSPSASPSASPSEGTPSGSPSGSPSATPSASPSASGAPPVECPVCWGHVTGVTETVLTFTGNWAGTGAIAGVGDAEVIELNAGEYMISEVVNTGSTTVTLEQNHYDPTGDDVDMDYRHGATVAGCYHAAWNNYVAPFASLGYIQVRLTSTL